MKGLLFTCIMLLNCSFDWKPAKVEEIYGNWGATEPLSMGRIYLYFATDVPIFTISRVDETSCQLRSTLTMYFRYLGEGYIDTYHVWEGVLCMKKFLVRKSLDSKQIRISSVPDTSREKDVLAITVLIYDWMGGDDDRPGAAPHKHRIQKAI